MQVHPVLKGFWDVGGVAIMLAYIAMHGAATRAALSDLKRQRSCFLGAHGAQGRNIIASAQFVAKRVIGQLTIQQIKANDETPRHGLRRGRSQGLLPGRV